MEAKPMYDLSGTRRDILYALAADDATNGQDLIRYLEDAYGEDLTHSIYQALSGLVEDGYVERVAIDARSNAYLVTADGREALEKDLEWRVQQYEKSLFSD